MDDQTKIYDITIIGGGPAGLFAAFYAGMRKANVKIIESLPQLGGQLSTLYPEKYIYDIPGFPKVRAQELVNNLIAQMKPFEPTVCLEEAVASVEKQADGTFEISTNQDMHYSKAIIITAGNGAFQPRRLELDDALQYEGKNLHYFINDLNRFSGRRVAVCGGGDSAVDWALMLEPIAKEVTIIHRRNAFRAHEHSVEKLENSSITVKTPFIPTDIIGDSEQMTQIVLEEVKGDRKEVLEIDDFIVNYGFVSSLGPIKEWGLDIERNSIVVNSKMETNIPGIYSAGDVCTYDGKVKLIATGFGEAPTAVNNAMNYIDPKSRVQPMHSSSMFD
ncbi:NAD(P)/FAD-dependent oxidoreductase [Listeria booriae]|uniref:NAD(P)/FAD-dependent oxidoreductase n=1 Tax=Listeria booriae TaxID=1552123 RepID=UPI001628C4B7|nr:NAD(P)/FAD-dependent oxidoreductase [Listeria booriae]MBC1812036.1 NAD(P)/FAD-dependent oxidoreductase [Listeria booriae]